MNRVWQDVREAARMLRRSPGFSAGVSATLAITIGANAAVFSLVNAVLLRPLPFPDPDALVTYWLTSTEGSRPMEWTEGQVAAFRERSRLLAGLAAYDAGSGLNLTGAADPVRLSAATVTHDFFRVLGREPALGRAFLPEEDRPGRNHVAMLSHRVWRRQFGGDPGVVGRAVRLNDVPTTIVGVMPEDVGFPAGTDLWIPVGLDPGDFGLYYIEPLARLKPGVSPAAAAQEMTAMWRELSGSGDPPAITVRPLDALVTGESRTPLLVLLGAALVVLLVACANLGNLMLVRANRRAGEMAVRASLGATTGQLARQLVAESAVLVAVGAAGGLLVAVLGVRAIGALAAIEGPHIEQLDLLARSLPRVDEAGLDLPTAGFTVALALVVAVLLGAAPALRGSRVDAELLLRGGRGAGSRKSRRLTDGFVVGQFALSLVLMATAGLLFQSLRNMFAVDLGFRPAGVWVGRVELPEAGYAGAADIRAFYTRLLERVEVLPGVRSAGLCQRLPFFGGGDGNPFTVVGREPRPGDPMTDAWWRDVSPGYFETMGIALLRGRAFDATDTPTSERVAVVDQKFAETHWPGEDPIGRRLRLGRPEWGNPALTVAGVVASVRHRSPDEDPQPYVYFPIAQDIQPSMYLVARTADDPSALTASVRAAVASLDRSLPLFEVGSMEQAVAGALATRRLTIRLVAGLAIAALALAAVGIYSVTALSVASRVHEFGVRVALGARPAAVLRMVLVEELRLVLVAVGIGLVGAVWVGGTLDLLLFGVAPSDVRVLGAVLVVLTAVALCATAIPARRAMRVAPMEVLRAD